MQVDHEESAARDESDSDKICEVLALVSGEGYGGADFKVPDFRCMIGACGRGRGKIFSSPKY
jgi:hypothetical protein